MVDYRKINSARDLDIAKRYCSQNGIEYPKNSTICFGAFDEEDNIIGVSALIMNAQIEPLIGGSSVVANVLLEKALACASIVTNQVEIVVNQENVDVIDVARRRGFIVKDENMTILRKEI